MRLLAFALMILTTFASFGITDADSVKVYFRVGHRQYDPSLEDNRQKMNQFIAKVNEAAANDNIERIEVRGYASPDGTNMANERLAHNRCITIASYIAANTGIDRALIEEYPMGIAWDELRRMVAANPEVPAREKILDILDNTPVWIYDSRGRIVDGRKRQLMNLQGGRPYNWMLANLFPELRNAVAVKLCLKKQPQPVSTQDESTTPADTVIALPDTAVMEPATVPAEQPAAVEYDYNYHNFALKSNLLFDAALMPNIGLEWLINDKWSVGLEWDVAWWTFPNDKVYRIGFISPEVRYHINPRAKWHGLYVGAFAGAGLYDLRNSTKGHEGEGLMAGLSVGYMWPITKHLSLDAGAGVGYLRARDKEYQPLDGHYLYQLTKNINYFGPLRLNLSLVWRFQCKTIRSNK